MKGKSSAATFFAVCLCAAARAQSYRPDGPAHYSGERSDLVLGIFYGIMVYICVHELLAYGSQGRGAKLSYVGFFASIGLIIFINDGMGSRFLWGENAMAGAFVSHIFTCLTCAFGNLLFKYVFRIKSIAPLLDKALGLLIALDALVAAIGATVILASGPGSVVTYASIGLGVLHSALFIVISARLVRNREPGTVLYLAGFGLSILGTWFQVSRYYFPALDNPFFAYGMNWGVLGNALCSLIVLRQRAAAREASFRAERERMLQDDKMVSLGVIASSVAHDIANPNSAIANDAAYLERSLPAWLERLETEDKAPGGETAESGRRAMAAVSGIRNSSTRIASIVSRLRAFYRPNLGEAPGKVDLLEAARSARDLLEAEAAKRRVRIILESGAGVPAVRGRARGLEQVAVNLLLNAIQAAGQGKDPVVWVRADSRSGLARLAVSDNGKGMDEEARAKAGELFFTTKGKDGSGMGLYICRTIVEEHGGRLDISEREGGGTVVTASFPAFEGTGKEARGA